MQLVDEIREGFASIKKNGAREISSLPKEYLSFVIRTSDGYGVAIEVDDKLELSERFNSCRFYTYKLGIEGKVKNYLLLSSAFEDYRYEFASICAEFIEPGESGVNRSSILADPFKWWSRWKELIGNTSRDQRVYNVIAEMAVLNEKFKADPSAEWTALRSGSHDIECKNESYEVKSTIQRYGAYITISGQHQLEHIKPLWICFYRMEESQEGVSINDMMNKLISIGYDANKLEVEIERQGFEKGASIRNKKYKVLEQRKYAVDDSFPRIVKESFKDDKYPDAITHIEYTIDLDAIEYTT